MGIVVLSEILAGATIIYYKFAYNVVMFKFFFNQGVAPACTILGDMLNLYVLIYCNQVSVQVSFLDLSVRPVTTMQVLFNFAHT